MKKDTRILCVCRNGNVRSVATKYALNRRGYNDVLTVGFDIVSKRTLMMLCEWADVILVAKRRHIEDIPDGFRKKINDRFIIGDDIWGTPVNLGLEEIINRQLNIIGL